MADAGQHFEAIGRGDEIHRAFGGGPPDSVVGIAPDVERGHANRAERAEAGISSTEWERAQNLLGERQTNNAFNDTGDFSRSFDFLLKILRACYLSLNISVGCG